MSKLYENVNDVPKGSIGNEAIVREMKIASIKWHKEEPIAKPVIGRYDVETVKTICTIVLVGSGIDKVDLAGIPYDAEGNDARPLEIGIAGEREVVVVQGMSVCRSMDDYIEEFEKEDSYEQAMNKLAQLKIVANGFVDDKILIVKDGEYDAEMGKYVKERYENDFDGDGDIDSIITNYEGGGQKMEIVGDGFQIGG